MCSAASLARNNFEFQTSPAHSGHTGELDLRNKMLNGQIQPTELELRTLKTNPNAAIKRLPT